MKALKKRLRVLQKTRKPGSDSLEDWQGVHLHHLKVRTLPGHRVGADLANQSQVS
jgi:hypothetical protein